MTSVTLPIRPKIRTSRRVMGSIVYVVTEQRDGYILCLTQKSTNFFFTERKGKRTCSRVRLRCKGVSSLSLKKKGLVEMDGVSGECRVLLCVGLYVTARNLRETYREQSVLGRKVQSLKRVPRNYN